MIKHKTKLLIFDLDGVLINSKPNMRKSLKMTSKKLNLSLSFQEYEKHIGLPFKKILINMKIKKDFDKIKKNYEFFSTQNLKNIKIDKKKVLILKSLYKECNLAVFTSKSRIRSKIILNRYNFIDYLITADDVKNGKPHPEGLLKIIKKFKKNRKKVLFIGDSIYDYKASKLAKIQYLHASWGYQKNTFSKKIRILKNLNELKGIIKRWN